jgi:hypothetical protein
MPIQKQAPYAPAKTVLSIIDRFRNRGLQVPIDLEVLSRAGVSESLAPRTLQALRLLDLIDEAGNPTDTLDALRLARSDEYQQRFAAFLRTAYSDVFQYVDPVEDDEECIRDAFRAYEPRGQQGRMVSLFVAFAEHAGLRDPAKFSASNGERTPAPRRTTPAALRSRPIRAAGGRETPPVTLPSSAQEQTDGLRRYPSEGLPPALAGLLASLPQQGEAWTQAQRDRFLTTFGAVLDFVYPVVPDEQKLPL